MKKWMTVVFASMLTVALSTPGWSQSATAKKNQTTTADKQAKKEDAKKKKADKKAAAKKAKVEKKDAKKSASKK